MKIDSFKFHTFHTANDSKHMEEFVMTLIVHRTPFEVFYEDDDVIIETRDISRNDYVEYSEYAEDAEDDDDDYDYDEPSDLEIGFNPYMGCYDYDC